MIQKISAGNEKSEKSAAKNTVFTENRLQVPFGIATCFLRLRRSTCPTDKGGVRGVTVYLDAVFVLNFLVNTLLLRTTARIGAAAIRTKRVLLAALLGAAYAVLVYVLPWLTGGFWKLLCAAGMLLLAFGCRRSTLRLTAVFAAMTLVLCGAVYAVELVQGGTVRYHRNALFYPVSFFTLLLTAAAMSLASRLLLPRLTHAPDSILPVTVKLRDRQVQLTALRDSGNTLADPVSGEAVMTVDWQAAKRLFPPELHLKREDFAAPTELALRLRAYAPRLIPYRAVGTSAGLLLALPCELTFGTKTTPGLVAISPTPLSDGGAYDALIGGNYA